MDVKKTTGRIDMQTAIAKACDNIKQQLITQPPHAKEAIRNTRQLKTIIKTTGSKLFLEYALLRGFIFNRAIASSVVPQNIAIAATCDEIKELLLEKNKAYGDSAANPIRCFSSVPPIEQINVRLDDKLSRMMRGHEYQGDDTEIDFVGYLLLKRAIFIRDNA